MPFCSALPAKRLVCEFERPQLRLCDALIVDNVLPAQALDLLFQAGGLQAGKFRHRLHVDVERIEEQTAVRRVGTGVRRPVVEQSVQRV